SPLSYPWLALYDSCDEYGTDGHEHGGWDLQSGVTYTLTMVFVDLIPSPNPPDGWGVDAVAITRFEADPSQFPTAPYAGDGGAARYQRSYVRGADNGISQSEVRFATYNEYMSAFLTTHYLDARGGLSEYSYSADGLLTMETGPEVTLLDGGGTVRSVHTYEYDENNRMIRQGVTGSDGPLVFTEYTYDELGQLITIIKNADGPPDERAVTSYGYNAYGERTTVTDPCGNVKETFYGYAGRITDEVAYESGAD
ncbi:unnamed protein product, partial [marine sediment metagenome]